MWIRRSSKVIAVGRAGMRRTDVGASWRAHVEPLRVARLVADQRDRRRTGR